MIFSRADITCCFKVGQLIFRPLDETGKMGNVFVVYSRDGHHPLKTFVRTTISDPNQAIYEPTVSLGKRGIITWLMNDDGSPYLSEDMPDNWYALRIRRECKANVFNATILTADELALEYYILWRQEIAKIFDDFEAVCGLPFELSPNSLRFWFQPEFAINNANSHSNFGIGFRNEGFNVKQIVQV